MAMHVQRQYILIDLVPGGGWLSWQYRRVFICVPPISQPLVEVAGTHICGTDEWWNPLALWYLSYLFSATLPSNLSFFLEYAPYRRCRSISYKIEGNNAIINCYLITLSIICHKLREALNVIKSYGIVIIILLIHKTSYCVSYKDN